MSNFNPLLKHLNEKFNNANLKPSGPLAPRNGYYFIKEVNLQDFKDIRGIPIATCYWNGTEDNTFYTDVNFQIALTNLNPKIEIDFTPILGKIIVISNAKLVTKNIHGKNRDVVECDWAIAEINPIFTTLKNAALHTEFANAKASIGTVYDEPNDDFPESDI